MPNKIILKKNIIAGTIPTALQLDVGELAINATDGKLFTKRTDNLIIELTNLANLTGSLNSIQHGSQLSSDLHHSVVTSAVNGFMSKTDKVKLDNIISGAQPNQNSYSFIKSTDNEDLAGANNSTDTFTFRSANNILSIIIADNQGVFGDNALFTINENNISISNLSGTITETQHGNITNQLSHSLVNTTLHGFMSSTDKIKLDSIASNATNNSTDVSLRDRTTHTGVQPISTITSLQSTLDSKEASFSVLSIAKGGTGSSIQNYVDLTTNQSISGTKTLTQVNIVAPNTSTRPLTIKGAASQTSDLFQILRSDDSIAVSFSINTGSSSFKIRGTNTFIDINQADGGTGTDSLTAFNPIPGNATSQVQFRFFRSTNTTGSCGITIFKGDNTTTSNAYIGANGNSHLNSNVGNLGIGTESPNAKLHVVGGVVIATATGFQTNPGNGNLTVNGLTTTNTLTITNVNTWITPTLLNTWTNFGAPSATARYRKLPDGTIEFKGTIKKTTTPVTNESIFNLPVGFRPLEYRNYIVSSNNGVGVVIVQSNGDVVFSFGSNIWLSLENIRFVAEA